MFLNKTIEVLKSSNLGGTNAVLNNSELIKKYFRLKFKHEKEARDFKENQVLKGVEEIYESGIFYACSHRKVQDVFSIVSKMNRDLNHDVQADKMFEILINSFSYTNAKEPYYNNEETLKQYWKIRLKDKEEFRKFKDEQRLQQKEIRDELLGEGFIPQILSNAYTNIKLSISNFRELGSDLELYRGEDTEQFKNSLELVMTEIFEEEVQK